MPIDKKKFGQQKIYYNFNPCMAYLFKNNLNEGINLDFNQLRISPNAVMFLKNMTQNVNQNAGSTSGAGSTQYTTTPLEGNKLLNITLPSGTNFCIGFYSSEQSNEGYFVIQNSLGNHTIWVISGDNGTTRLVYQDGLASRHLFNFVLDPQYYMAEGRCTLELRSFIDKVTTLETNFKFFIFTIGKDSQYFISVEDSIATTSYTTAFFTASAAFYDPLELIHLGVPTPLKCIGLNTPTAYTPAGDDDMKQNLLVRQGWQFRVKMVDFFGRESEHGIISQNYISLAGGGCVQSTNGLPRCLMLNFDAGNPLVNQITVEYRQWKGNDRGGALATDWKEYETFNKRDNSSGRWYTRAYNPLFSTSGSGVTIDLTTNLIAYTFCADKGSIPIDPVETARTEPGLAISSGSLGSINKRIFTANDVYGFEPIPPSTIAKVAFSAILPDPTALPCEPPPLRRVVVYANLYNPFGRYSTIMRTAFGKVVFGESDDGDCATGVASGSSRARYTSSFKLDQVFGDQEHPGFIAYIAGMTGSQYAAIGVQGDFDPTTKIFTPVGYGDGSTLIFPHQKMIRFEFNIPAMKGVVRVASHKAKITDPDFQQTSTYVAGQVRMGDVALGGSFRELAYPTTPIKEISFDARCDNVIYDNSGDAIFLIMDLGDGVNSFAVDGYLYEQPGGAPVELNPIRFYGDSIGATHDAFGSFYTDHNGFFFATSGGVKTSLEVWSDLCDNVGTTKHGTLTRGGGTGDIGGITHVSNTGTLTGACFGVQGYWRNTFYISTPPYTYYQCARRRISSRVGLCSDHAIGVPGLPVILSNGASTLTDSSGAFTIVAHNRYDYPTAFGGASLPYLGSLVPGFGAGIFDDIILVTQKGGCSWTFCAGTDCGFPEGCTPGVFTQTITYIACCDCFSTPGCRDTDFDNDWAINVIGVNVEGVQSGGKYQVGFVLHDVIGRHTFVQVGFGESKFVYVPNLNDTSPSPFPVMALCQLGVTIDPSIVFPSYFTRMTLYVSSNLQFTDYMSWPADAVQFVDNTGTTNNTNPTSIRIYWQSLNEYKKLYNFQTNNNWQPIVSNQNNSPVNADIVQFIKNGDGSWMAPGSTAQITYDQSGSFFVLEFTQELARLINGCLFRIIRPSQDTSGENVPMYEQCFTIPLVNGIPKSQYLNTLLTIPYIDSYLISRSIPIPVMKGQATLVPPGAIPSPAIQYTNTNINADLQAAGYAQNNLNNSNGVIIFDVNDISQSFPFLFEGPSPSDLWGSHLADRGRVNAVNPYEAQVRLGTEIALSAALGDRPNSLNGLSYFTDANKVSFDRNTWGNIIAVLVETSTCLVICDRDHFIIHYDGAQVVVSPQGTITAQNPYGFFTAPQRKAGTNYGCALFDINTIRRYAGTVCWVDASGYLVFHDFSTAKEVQDNGYDGYYNNKISIVSILNLDQTTNGLTYFVAGIDPRTWQYYLTSFNIPHTGSPSYINQESFPLPTRNETFIIDLKSGKLKGFASFTPEYLGIMPGYFKQSEFISFKGGKPYLHHDNSLTVGFPLYVNFYGVQCECRVTIVGNPESELVKNFLHSEVYTKQNIPGTGTFPTSLFYCDIINTEKGQFSRLLTQQWEIKDGFSCAAFLCDLNTPADTNLPVQTGIHKITDGNPLMGRWIQVSYVTQSAYAGTYFELSAIIIGMNGIPLSGDGQK